MVSALSNEQPELLASLRRMRSLLAEALADDWGANAYEEIVRHLDPVLAELERGLAVTETTRRAVGSLGAQLQAADGAGLLDAFDRLRSEADTLVPLLEDYLRRAK